MKTLNMTFEDYAFEKLKVRKLESKKARKLSKLSWEHFIFDEICEAGRDNC